MIARLTTAGMSVCRVTKPSKNPAMMKTGTKPMTIFTPRIAPILSDSMREYVRGKRMLCPTSNPAAPAITIADNSRVPWMKTVRIDS